MKFETEPATPIPMRARLFLPGDKPLLHIGLLLLTLASTFATFFYVFGGGTAAGTLKEQLWGSAQFSLSLVAILGAHEMGHYLFARHHQVATSLPYFIPLPFLGVGTLGAVIRIKGRIPTKNALIDIGASGPLAGLAVALPLLIWGLLHSHVGPSPAVAHSFPGPQSLWVLWEEAVKYWSGAPRPPVASGGFSLLFGDNLLMKGMVRFVFGPLPQGHDVYVHPVVIASWFGLLVTMLNLIPVGQLDGGHVAHAMMGKHARFVGKLASGGLLFLSLYFSAGWLLWFFVATFFIGFNHPPVMEETQPVSRLRRGVAWLCLLVFILCIMPVPLSQVPAP